MASKTFPTETKVTDIIRKTTEYGQKINTKIKNCPILTNRIVIYIYLNALQIYFKYDQRRMRLSPK